MKLTNVPVAVRISDNLDDTIVEPYNLGPVEKRKRGRPRNQANIPNRLQSSDNNPANDYNKIILNFVKINIFFKIN